MTFERVSFGSIADFRNGLNYSRENMGVGLKVISVGNFGDRTSPDYDSIGEIDPSGVAGDDDLMNDGDILFVRSNGNRELVARVMYITTPPYPVAYSGFCIRARMNRDVVNPKFYYYVFRSKETRMEWMKETEICVVVSSEQGEVEEFRKWKLDILPHREKMFHRELALEFKKPENPFRVVIVCAMWLTGFDVKCLATLYLDKPMKGHTLMQAIARVNRVGGGKKMGLIIDYNGMLKSLRKALATFAQGDGKGNDQDILREDPEAVAEYGQSIRETQNFLTGCGFSLEKLIAATGFEKQAMILQGVEAVCKTDEGRKTFEVMADDITARFRGLFPNPGLYAYDKQENAITAIYNRLQESKETPDVSERLQALYEVVDTAVTTAMPTREHLMRYELTKIDISRLQAEFERKYPNTKMLNLREKIEKRLEAMIARNPTRVDLYERYQEIVAEYNKDKDAVEVQKVFDDLFKFNDGLDQEQRRYLREGLDNEDQLAVFDLLQKDTLTRVEREQIKEVAKELLGKLLSGKLRIDNWREKATAQAQVKAEIIKHLFVNLPGAGYTEHEISARADMVFAHLYQPGIGASGSPLYH
jgi:type I restriction enzyme R subunit